MKEQKMELNREQIIKALECCISGVDCTICPLCDEQSCPCVLNENALTLIKELTEENENLMAQCRYTTEAFHSARADTVRKMQERLIKCFDNKVEHLLMYTESQVLFVINQIAKEMEEEND